MNKMSQLAWAAGFLEGEGCFRTQGGSPRLDAAQIQKEPLTKLQTWFGGHLRTETMSAGGKIWRWDLHGAHAAAMMFTLFPLLSPKRRCKITEVILAWRASKGRQRHNDRKRK